MHMNAGMDTGAIVDQLAFKLPFERTVKELIAKMQQSGPQFLNDTLRSYAKAEIQSTPQNENQATTCNKISKADGELQLEEDKLEEIYAKYRAYAIRPKVWFSLQGKKVSVEELVIDQEKFEKEKKKLIWDEQYQLNACIQTLLLKPEGKKAMDFASFKNGYLK